MIFDKEQGKFIEGTKENTPTPPKENDFKYSENRRLIDDKKAELELKKIEIELENLKKPDTKIDYFEKMLQIQSENNKQIMAMMEKNFQTQLEIEKLKLSNDGDDFSWLKDLLPLLPSILKKEAVSPVLNPNESNTALTIDENAKKVAMKGGNMLNIKNKNQKELDEKQSKSIEDYKKDIQSGVLKEEQAYEDFKKELPQYAKAITKENFHEYFMKIKRGENVFIGKL
jgi:hypothetical protein